MWSWTKLRQPVILLKPILTGHDLSVMNGWKSYCCYYTVCRMGGKLHSLIPFMLLICAYSTGFYFGFHYLWHLTSLIHTSYPTPESMLDATCHLTWNSCFKENKDLRSSGPWELYNFSVRHQIRRDSNLVKITSISVTHSGVMVNHSKPFALIRL